MPVARTIIENDNVASKIDEAKEQYPRSEDVWEGLKWRLALKPEQGEDNSEGFYLMKSTDLFVPAIPILTVLYTFNREQVEVLDIRISETEIN